MNDNPSISITPESVYEALKACFDPEIPVNIVDLGLIYDVFVCPDNKVEVMMTLTTPGCSMGEQIANDARFKILGISGVKDAEVKIVWDPPWNQNMISEAGRKKLGMS